MEDPTPEQPGSDPTDASETSSGRPTHHDARAKRRKERAAERESQSKTTKRKRFTREAILYALIGLAIFGIGYGAYYTISSGGPIGELGGLGSVGSEHTHMTWQIMIDGKDVVPTKFAEKKYQLRADYVHMEGGATEIHKHATGVTIGHFFQSLGAKFNSTCLILDTGEKYCNDSAANKTLVFEVNGKANELFNRYEMRDGDKLVISYG